MVDAGLSIEAGAGDAELPAQAVDVSELLSRQAGAAAIPVARAAPSLRLLPLFVVEAGVFSSSL
jgi:hypothetical protein